MSGGGGGGGGGTAGFRYYFGIFMGICRGPIDELVEIKVGDRLAWQGSVTKDNADQEQLINAPNLFGGDAKEGGIVGYFRLLLGHMTQTAAGLPDGLKSLIAPSPLTGYRRRATLYYDGLVTSVNPYPKVWQLRVRRALEGWDGEPIRPEKAIILMGGAPPAPPPPPPPPPAPGEPPPEDPYAPTGSGDYFVDEYLQRLREQRDQSIADQVANTILSVTPNLQIKAMNPAHIIFEAFTNREWGRGLPRSAIDIESFEDAADRLFTEGFGLCMAWKRTDSINAFVKSVLDHICAVVYTDRTSALLTLKLIRGDYNQETLKLWTTANGLLEIRDSGINTSNVVINELIVKFVDPVEKKDGVVRVHNLAALQANQGAANPQTREYPGIPTSALARRVAQRDLRAMAEGLKRFELVFDRRGWSIVPGSVIRIADAHRNIPDIVVRVATVEDGTLRDGKIKVTVAEDVFALPSTTFTQEQPPTWEPPSRLPCIGRHRAFEIPYFLLARKLGNGSTSLAPSAAFLGTVAERGQTINVGYDIAVRDSEPTVDDLPTEEYYCGYVPPAPGP